MNRRRELRVRRRFGCEVDSGQRRQLGTILDLSHQGLFVQTRIRLASNARLPLQVRFALPTRKTQLCLSTQVVRQYRVPAALFTAAGGGLGLQIQSAPDAWRDFVEGLSPNQLLTRPDTPTAPAATDDAPGCVLCGRSPVAGTRLCTRCGAERPSA